MQHDVARPGDPGTRPPRGDGDTPARGRSEVVWESLDALVQTLVAAETALDLGYHSLARALVTEACSMARDQVGTEFSVQRAMQPGDVRRVQASQAHRDDPPNDARQQRT